MFPPVEFLHLAFQVLDTFHGDPLVTFVTFSLLDVRFFVLTRFWALNEAEGRWG